MKRVFAFIPVVIVAVIILLLTLQSAEGTVGLSEGFRNWLVSVCNRFGWDTFRGWIDSPVAIRRLGHVIEFFFVGIGSGDIRPEEEVRAAALHVYIGGGSGYQDICTGKAL